jgi:hypothetical protein
MNSVDSSTISRLCPECLTTDAAFPLKIDCKSCRQVLIARCAETSHDEFRFWNIPVILEPEYEELSTSVSYKHIIYYNIITLFFKYICLS